MPEPSPTPTIRWRRRRWTIGALAVAVTLAACAAAPLQAPRAKPPKFSDADRAAFFEDAFEMLSGPRPDFAASRATVAGQPVAGSIDSASGGDLQWSRWIDADTVETEIKRQIQDLAAITASATKFKGGGYRECRDAFSVLAMMFSIAADHDDDARWNDIALGLGQLLGRAAANCKVGTDNSYREANARSQDLAELIRGSRPDVPSPDKDADWGARVDRSPLMQRMELAWQDRLGPLTANERAFKRGSEEALHEAQVLAALSEVLTLEGFADAGDDEYDALARALRDAAADIARAAEQEDHSTVREAYGRAGKACSECHDLYRG